MILADSLAFYAYPIAFEVLSLISQFYYRLNRYFLIENRQNYGFDYYINGSGLLIYHVNENRIAGFNSFGPVNDDENDKMIDLESADGLTHLDDEINRGDAGDPFPGSTNNILFSDNTICICSPSAFRFYDKVFYEIKAMFDEADHSMGTFNIGADELPFGVWKNSPICDEYINNSSDINSYQDLYDSSIKRINKTIVSNGSRMSGWEDVLLIHSEKSQSEIDINKNLLDIDFIPSVWNNTWGEGREDMIYKLSNIGFQSIMSNSSAFYFDMTDDMDMENPGLNWSGFVNYKDTWGTEPLNVFANKVKLKSLRLDDNDFKNRVRLKEDAVSNFLGIQSQLWTETATSVYHFDRMLMPNLIIFSERAWSSKEDWLDKKTAEEQEPLLNKSWNRFVNTVGQRHLPMISKLYEDILFDIPKAGGIIENGTLKIRQQFPGLHIRYTTDGSEPDLNSSLYSSPVKISSLSDVVIRVFDINGRGGNSINIKQK